MIFRALGIVVASILIGPGFFLATRSLFPRYSQRSSDAWSRPFLNLLIGLVVGIPFILAGQMLPGGRGVLEIVRTAGGMILIAIPMVFGMAGLTGLASRIGKGLKVVGEEAHSWKATLRGGIVLGLVAGLPLGGDGFLCLALLVAAGLGNLLRTARPSVGDRPFTDKKRDVQKRPPRTPNSGGDAKNADRRARQPRRNRPPRPRDADRRSDGASEKKE